MLYEGFTWIVTPTRDVPHSELLTRLERLDGVEEAIVVPQRMRAAADKAAVVVSDTRRVVNVIITLPRAARRAHVLGAGVAVRGGHAHAMLGGNWGVTGIDAPQDVGPTPTLGATALTAPKTAATR